jgi:hypothetical protein
MAEEKGRWLRGLLRVIVGSILIYALATAFEPAWVSAEEEATCCMQDSDCTSQGFDGCDTKIPCAPQIGTCYSNAGSGG